MCHNAIAQVALIVVCHPSVDIASLGSEFPTITQMVPRDNTAECLLTLSVIKVGFVAVVYGKHCQLAVRVYVPRIKANTVALARVVVDLLKQMEVLVRTATISLHGVVLVYNIHILIVDILLFVVVAIFVIVW